MIKRITDSLAGVGMVRADATINSISGLLPKMEAPVCESKTCGECPDGCPSVGCAEYPVVLPPKSPFWPPEDLFQREEGPPPNLVPDYAGEYEWFTKTVLENHPKAVLQSETEYALTDTEETLVKMSLTEWLEKRKDGSYTCVEMATALTKRAKYLQHVQNMNHFMYWESFDWIPVVLEQAKALDEIAAEDGIDAISPLYCYPIPLKGTMATEDFPSSLGFAALHYNFALEDAALVKLIKEANGVQFGKTNVPEHAHSYGTGNYANGIAFNPWDYDMMTGGSSGGSGAAVASYTAAIAITEDTYGSTNTPATRNHLFGYDPPKFHYPNAGNPSLTVRNDQLGVNARSFQDIISFDKAVLDTEDAHAAAKAYVDGLSNSDIKIGCSPVFYAYEEMTDAIATKYEAAKSILEDAGFTFVTECLETNPVVAVPYSGSASSAWYPELKNHIEVTLGLDSLSTWDVILNGAYDFGTSLSFGWFYNGGTESCDLINDYTPELVDAYLGPVPANRSDVYNEYFDSYDVDLLMGPTQICDKVLWTEDIGGTAGINEGCDGGKFVGNCMSNCHTRGVRGSFDKTFTKAKFVVPVGLTEIDEPFSLHFMTRAGPRNPSVPASEWVFDEEGPMTWNLEEMYMVERITNVLEAAGFKREDATMNYVSGLLETPTTVEISK